MAGLQNDRAAVLQVLEAAGRALSPESRCREPWCQRPVMEILRFRKGVRRDPAVDGWLKDQPVALGDVARSWFVRMRECGPDVRELLHDGCPVACVGDAPFAYVNVFRAHSNVGFFYGAELADPARLLEGSGKRMRHVKVKPNADLDSRALAALVVAAYADIKRRLDLERFIVGARG